MHCVRQCILTFTALMLIEIVIVHAIDSRIATNPVLLQSLNFEPSRTPLAFNDVYERNLRTETNRKLLAPNSNNVCIWDDYNRSCVWDLRRIAELLFSSRDKFIRYLSNYPFCNAFKTENSCVIKKQCHWNRWTNQCLFGDLKFGHTHSPCVKAAPAVFADFEAKTVCPKQRSLSACTATQNCIWGNGVCNADYVKIFFGIDSNAFFNEAEKVANAKTTEVTATIKAQFDIEAFSFDWSKLFRWKIPDTSCPKHATPMVCNYANAWVKTVVPTELYCSRLNPLFSVCNRDPLCSYSYDKASCIPSSYTIALAHANAIVEISRDVPNGADRHIISAYFFCPIVLTPSACNGACEWFHAAKRCVVRRAFESSWIAAPMQTSSIARSDPVCLLSSYFANSGCEKLYSRSTCNNNQYCSWGANNVCYASSVRITAAVLSSLNDPSLTNNKVFPNCSRYKTAQQCALMEEPQFDPVLDLLMIRANNQITADLRYYTGMIWLAEIFPLA